MDSLRKQRTIRRTAEAAGFGYWSGRDIRLEFRPAEADCGIVFVRRDLPGCPRIPASLGYRVEVPRRTSLRRGEANVEMVEHVMASLSGLQIDNCEIWVDQAEMPGMDGSAIDFVEALSAAGIVEQHAPRAALVVSQPVRLGSDECWIEARPVQSPTTVVRYDLDYGLGNPIGRQAFEIALSPESFCRELAPCRTFMLKAEAEFLLSQGMGQRTSTRDLLVYGEEGPIDNEERFPDECVRHKVLDMVGDLALVPCDLVGRFSALRTGHKHNAELLRALISASEASHRRRRCA